jgi:hypothetical protein
MFGFFKRKKKTSDVPVTRRVAPGKVRYLHPGTSDRTMNTQDIAAPLILSTVFNDSSDSGCSNHDSGSSYDSGCDTSSSSFSGSDF